MVGWGGAGRGGGKEEEEVEEVVVVGRVREKHPREGNYGSGGDRE